MNRGVVNARGLPFLQLRLRGASGVETTEDAIIDTAFSQAVTLPRAIVGYLGLTYATSIDYILGDGTCVELDMYAAEVEWDGVWKPINVTLAEGNPLLGRVLLNGHQLSIAHVPGGLVEITPLP